MKGKEQLNNINFLHKRFKFLEKNDIKMIFEFCDNSIERTEKILMIVKDLPNNTKCVTKILRQKPQKSEAFLHGLEKQYFQKYGGLPKTTIMSEKQNGCNNAIDFFYYIPMDACLTIMKFLDPYSFSKFSQTSKKMYKVSSSDACSDYFRILCVNLFEKIEPRLPQYNRFLHIRKYVLDRPHQFGPNTRNVVINKLRYYIWQFHPTPLKKSANFYQKYGSYRQIFLKSPRIHFNGFYVCKHQYRKEEQKDILQTASNVHLVRYYRYIRFIDDGSALCGIFSNKLKQAQVVEFLSLKNLDKNMEQLETMKQLMVGQYFIEDTKILVKIAKGATIFNYQLQIGQQEQNKNNSTICPELIVLKYWLKVVSEQDIIQNLEDDKKASSLKFKYIHNLTMARENRPIVRASSL